MPARVRPPQKPPVPGRVLGSGRAGQAAIFLSVALGVGLCGPGCDSGELRLYEVDEQTGAGGLETSPASGGVGSRPGASGGQGGSGQGEGSTGGNRPDVPDHPIPDWPAPTPCIVDGFCLPTCLESPVNCIRCESPAQCPPSYPACDPRMKSCVECSNGEQCRQQFGDEFDVCVLGRCVQCQDDHECEKGEECSLGWCGECDRESECPGDQICVRAKCVDSPF